MPNRDDLVAALTRSQLVVVAELQLLDLWGTQTEDPSRRGAIRHTANFISLGPSSAKTRADNMLDRAGALSAAEVTAPPAPHHHDAIQQTVDSVAVRAQWTVTELGDEAFGSALIVARNNAEQAAENSEVIFTDCTRPGFGGGGLAFGGAAGEGGAGGALMAAVRALGPTANRGRARKRPGTGGGKRRGAKPRKE